MNAKMILPFAAAALTACADGPFYWQNDYFGRIYVNGRLAHDGLNGPEPGAEKWGVRPVVLKKGKNAIVFETRHGMSGGWKCALFTEGP